jgi:hypothetical protein
MKGTDMFSLITKKNNTFEHLFKKSYFIILTTVQAGSADDPL